MSDVRTLLKKRPLLFDGGMGTYYKGAPGRECEQANRLDPEGIRAVHRAYLAAGADAIKTNTFGLPRMAAAQDPEWEALADAGWKLAAEAAAGTDAAVFADLGPAPDTEGLSAAQVYTAVVRRCRMPLCRCPLRCCRTATPARVSTAGHWCAAWRTAALWMPWA